MVKLSELHKLYDAMKQHSGPVDAVSFPDIIRSLGMEPGSIYQELEMESRYVETHRDLSGSNASINLHSHLFYELLFCRNSCGAEYLVGSDRYRLQKGDIIIVAPGVSHRPLLPESMPEPYNRDIIWISREFMESLFGQFPQITHSNISYATLLRTDAVRQEVIGNLFHTGVKESEARRPGWEMAVLGNTIQLLALLHRAFSDRSAAPLKAETPELLDHVMSYIEAHLSEKISLSEVAKQFYVSESTISHLFRKRMGVSFYRCVTQRRLISAKNLILSGCSLDRVAEQSGFSDYSSFYRAFKGEFGISPRQFRTQQHGTSDTV